MKIRLLTLLILSILGVASHLQAYEQAYSKTEVGQIQILELSPSRLIESKKEGSYFEHSNSLFRKLFKFIKDNEIAMTVPVEGELNDAKMRFYIGEDVPADIKSSENVEVKEMPARTVASIGSKGSYKEKNVAKALEKLELWLADQKHLEQDGEAYAVFWNAPFTPWFLKRFDVHIPVKEKASVPLAAN